MLVIRSKYPITTNIYTSFYKSLSTNLFCLLRNPISIICRYCFSETHTGRGKLSRLWTESLMKWAMHSRSVSFVHSLTPWRKTFPHIAVTVPGSYDSVAPMSESSNQVLLWLPALTKKSYMGGADWTSRCIGVILFEITSRPEKKDGHSLTFSCQVSGPSPFLILSIPFAAIENSSGQMSMPMQFKMPSAS